MIYIVTALDAEARPLIETYSLTRNHILPYTLYTGDEAIVLVCGMGKANAMMATSALLGYRIPQKGDILLNIGICAAPESFSVGEMAVVHQIIDHDRRTYPDILYPHSFRETPLLCVDAPQSTPLPYPADMESAGIFNAARAFFKLHRMAFVKIVSDHFEPHRVTRETAEELIRTNLENIRTVIDSLHRVSAEQNLFTTEEEKAIETLKTCFTHAQGVKLDDALYYFRLRFPGKPLPLNVGELPLSKRERSILHEQLILALVS